MGAPTLARLTNRGPGRLWARNSVRSCAYTNLPALAPFSVRESPPAPAAPCRFSLEERLRSAREGYRLLADLFNLQAEVDANAVAGLSARSDGVRLSGDGLLALRQLCLRAADDLERLARELPPAVANWQAGPERGT